MKRAYEYDLTPFDEGAILRLNHMGLIKEDGKVNQEAVEVLARTYAGLFFDTLCDVCHDVEGVMQLCRTMTSHLSGTRPQEVILTICTKYDYIQRPFPDTLWWISGNWCLLQPFATHFLSSLSDILHEVEVV